MPDGMSIVRRLFVVLGSSLVHRPPTLVAFRREPEHEALMPLLWPVLTDDLEETANLC